MWRVIWVSCGSLGVVHHAADLERVVLLVDLGRILLRIIGVERKRPRHHAVRIGRSQPVGIEQPALHPVVEV
jgi:hypothetical protein